MEEGHVVEEVEAVDAAVVGFVFVESEEEVVAGGVVAPARLGAGYHEDAVLGGGEPGVEA